MSETERIELLKAVADCAPEWMGAMYFDDEIYVRDEPKSHYVMIDGATSGDFILTLLDEYDDARAIIAMLDVMEKEGFIAAVYPDFKVPQGEPLKYYVKLKRYSDGITVLATIHGGETRAEAVARAFVAVFGGKE